jgi:hypothetical protein
MSVTYVSYAILGIRVPFTGKKSITQQRGCHHIETPHKFCPECGAETFIDVSEAVLEDQKLLRLIDLFESDPKKFPKNFIVQTEGNPDYMDEFLPKAVYFGVGVSHQNENCGSGIDIPDLHDLKNYLQSLIGATHPDDLKSFKLHTYLYVS